VNRDVCRTVKKRGRDKKPNGGEGVLMECKRKGEGERFPEVIGFELDLNWIGQF